MKPEKANPETLATSPGTIGSVNALRERYLENQKHCLNEESVNRAGGRPHRADMWMDRASIYGQIATDLELLCSPNTPHERRDQ